MRVSEEKMENGKRESSIKMNSKSNICLTKKEYKVQSTIFIEDNLQRKEAHLQRKLTQESLQIPPLYFIHYKNIPKIIVVCKVLSA